MQIGPDPASAPDDPGVSFEPETNRFSGLSFAGRSLTLTNGVIGTQADPVNGGEIALNAAGTLRIVKSTIYVNTDDVTEFSVDLPGEISLHSDGKLELVDSHVTADSLGDGVAGQIDIDGKEVLLVRTSLTSGSTPDVTSTGTGLAGVVEIEGRDGVELQDSFVTTETFSDTRIDFNAMPELDDRPGSIEINSPNGELLLADSEVTATTFGQADAGFVELDGSTIRIEDSKIASQQYGGGFGCPRRNHGGERAIAYSIAFEHRYKYRAATFRSYRRGHERTRRIDRDCGTGRGN